MLLISLLLILIHSISRSFLNDQKLNYRIDKNVNQRQKYSLQIKIKVFGFLIISLDDIQLLRQHRKPVLKNTVLDIQVLMDLDAKQDETARDRAVDVLFDLLVTVLV